ncbi:MAG TPA: hypothetical protein PKE39_01670 [Ignavibacteria bacterium]|nr:hypothetical protein [Ignavibacteria bacterium]
MRNQLITVPSCKKHNEDYHLIDDRVKIYIQGNSSSKIAYDLFIAKTQKGLNRPQSKHFANSLIEEAIFYKLGSSQIIDMNVEKKKLDLYFEKISKGLYYFHYEKIAIGRMYYFFAPYTPKEHYKYQVALYHFKRLINSNLIFEGNCHNPDIFFYHYGIIKDHFYLKIRFYKDVEVLIIFKLETRIQYYKNNLLQTLTKIWKKAGH